MGIPFGYWCIRILVYLCIGEIILIRAKIRIKEEGEARRI
jgi:hypothetical protein